MDIKRIRESIEFVSNELAMVEYHIDKIPQDSSVGINSAKAINHLMEACKNISDAIEEILIDDD